MSILRRNLTLYMLSKMSRQGLKFLEGPHEYWVGDRQIPSVTQIIRAGGESKDYSDIPEFILRRAGEIGTEVHKTIENYHEGIGELFSDDSSADDYLEGYRKFISQGVFEPLLAEERMYCDCHWFAGTVDLIGFVNNTPSVIDIKTTNTTDLKSWNLQTAAYKHLAIETFEIELENRYVIHLKKSGRFSLIKCDYPGAWERFESLIKEYYGELEEER